MSGLFRKRRKTKEKPVTITDKSGVFYLNQQYNWFEGMINWLGNAENVILDKDHDNDTAKKASETLHMLLEDMERWDEKLRSYAAEELIKSANDWRETEDTPEISEEEFAERIGSPSFHIFNDGDFEAAYGDDDMFYGHWIVVHGTAGGKLTDANIEG